MGFKRAHHFRWVLLGLALAACSNQEATTRARIAEAEVTGRQAAQAVESYMKKRGRYPAHIEEAYVRPAPLKDIKLLSVNRKTGVVQIGRAHV